MALTSPSAGESTRVLPAIALSLLGLLLLDSMGAIIKHLSADYAAPQLVAFRNLFGMAPSLLVLFTSRAWHRSGRPLIIAQWRLALFRGLLVAFAQICFYVSLAHLAFATAATLTFATPLFVTALTATLLREVVGPWRWLAVAVGFAGIVLVMRPGSEVFTPYALLPLGAALGYASSGVTVRLISGAVPSATVNLYSHLGALIGATAFMFATGSYGAVATLADWLWIFSLGTAGGLGVLCLVIAYRWTSPSNLAPFDYFGIPFSFALGWIFFAEAPFQRLFPGVVLIVAGGFLIVWRERRLARARALGSGTPTK